MCDFTFITHSLFYLCIKKTEITNKIEQNIKTMLKFSNLPKS